MTKQIFGELVMLIVFCCIASTLHAQKAKIKGRVISDRLKPLFGVTIFINDTIEVGHTDKNGFFSIEIPVSNRIVSFGDAGLDPTIVKLGPNCDEIELVMMLSGSDDFITLRKVDRIRKKAFKKLPRLHQEAFQKGFFTKEKPCYSREFIPMRSD